MSDEDLLLYKNMSKDNDDESKLIRVTSMFLVNSFKLSFWW
jgi:hypothetical protein